MPLQVPTLQVGRTMFFPEGEIHTHCDDRKDIAVKALQQLTSKCKWRPISIAFFWPQIVLKFDWASHILYELVIEWFAVGRKIPLSQPSRIHSFQDFFLLDMWFLPIHKRLYYRWIFLLASHFQDCESWLSFTQIALKSQRMKNVLFVLLFLNVQKNPPKPSRFGDGENIPCGYFLSGAGVNGSCIGTFRTVSSRGKNTPNLFKMEV